MTLFAQRLGFDTGRRATVDDQVRIRDRVVRETIKREVNFPDARLHPTDEGVQWAEAIFVGLASLDTSKRDNSVIKDPSDMCRLR